ncbi:MAG: alpha/beta hydrolase-fold protein [Verrucomicrobiota bacterium]|nr:alpha/beta hydrolase-fold protein [Verrucomicrobiota bacterium]
MIRLALCFVSLVAALPQPAYTQTAPTHAKLFDPEGEPIIVGSMHRIRSSVYGNEQTITVRLPRGYAENPDKRYPVLFSVDGGPDQDFELLAGIAAEAEFSTSFEPFILIGVKTEDRYKQLTPEQKRWPIERLKESFGDRMVPGGADKFRDYLARDVVPWATQRYRTDRKVLTAASLGGLFVLDTFLERPTMFDDFIALTPSVWWDDGRIIDEAAQKLATHGPSDRRLYLTMGDEGVGNRSGSWLTKLVTTLQTRAPKGLKWAFVDRSGSEEHRTMALISWLDAMRTLYLTPVRTGIALPLIYEGLKKPPYTPEVRANIDAGPCTRAIAKPLTFEEKNRRARELFGMCVLMKPGSEITAGNFGPADFGRLN